MPLLDIVQAGHPVLRQPARTLTPQEIGSPAIQTLIDSMRETMRDAPGVGLAAPQIGESLRLAVIEDPAEYQREIPPARLAATERAPVPFHVIVNPELEVEGDEIAEHFEGCLSVVGYTALVPRALRVRVRALDHRAHPVDIRARGWYARILQHEIDHLGGHLYVDRMHTRSFADAESYDRHLAARSVAEVRRLLGIS